MTIRISIDYHYTILYIKLKQHPFKIQLVQELNNHYSSHRLQFVNKVTGHFSLKFPISAKSDCMGCDVGASNNWTVGDASYSKFKMLCGCGYNQRTRFH